uniref:CBFD_NFYB_HMF domain-containing protein n=1 Tax=Ascaris lumbricoides TaxID=6252 RepID=A0A0M3HLF3_ASCLU
MKNTAPPRLKVELLTHFDRFSKNLTITSPLSVVLIDAIVKFIGCNKFSHSREPIYKRS